MGKVCDEVDYPHGYPCGPPASKINYAGFVEKLRAEGLGSEKMTFFPVG
jgi:hypothetical protein